MVSVGSNKEDWPVSQLFAWVGQDRFRRLAQVALGVLLLGAGIGHLTFRRTEFRAQVPEWVPLGVDVVVVASGVAEVALGLALLVLWRNPARALVGLATALFFVAVFPGNIAQFVEGKDAFGLDSDFKRGARLFLQPVLVIWAVYATDLIRTARQYRAARRQRIRDH